MNDDKRMQATKILMATVLIVAGGLFLINNLSWHHPVSIWELWPLLIVLGGISVLTQARQTGQYLDGSLLILVGLLLLERHINLIPGLHISWHTIWPLILVYIGLRILLWPPWKPRPLASGKDQFDIMAMFGGGEHPFSGQTLKGGSVRAIFGGCDLNFRDADMAGETASIQCLAAFGGIDIRVPDNWQVAVRGMPIFGAIENKTHPKTAANGVPAKTLVIDATVFFGAIEIKN